MFQQIDHEDTQQLINSAELVIIDVRDRESFERGHIVGAINLSMPAMQAFCLETNRSTPVLVYCYHGVSSQSVAQFLVEQGFSQVYSLQGGFEVWKEHHPVSGH
ncbi:MAG: thiosulfate sulfurtransferase [Gammaproteobacteria bacterium RIFCSPHIGHO2_12_FULL_41_15]|nr:MAG: thiosulfate sulfurtransferase [Gammaproteobacteria bacterium RIFCSPHIGHO2_12_FULL_41_15]